ncbi:DUF1566 domain-containing protein [Cupriavidus sp. AU9028]|uniref:Lcl domain-containing protein n=1 Tax=Cupriavidus sp. AU9028 TaxID=2871157 RepID=UPI001C95A1A5|nr:DUF1566 domain-containing protein [Cupriavidus sp. AU9028]MBY4897204.1 DUF1566 domain-containing protein [Cupriavidus sp. AU9028]
MRFRSLLLLTMLALLGGCGEDGDNVRSPAELTVPATVINGKAHLAAPLAGAMVQVSDAQGRAVEAVGMAVTGPAGTFSFRLGPRSSSRMRLKISGGTYEGKPFNGTLLLDVDGYDASRDLLYANAATTLVAQYVDRHPDVALDEANARVLGFLAIPAASRSAPVLDNPHQNHFRHELVLAAMRAAGADNLNRYLGTLLDEMKAGTPTRRFANLGSGGPADTIAGIARKLAGHLGSEVFTWAFESILTLAGTGATAELLEQLHEINAKLDALTSMVAELQKEAEQTQVEIVNTPVLAAIANIRGQYQYLTWAAQHGACASSDPAHAACADGVQAFQQSVRDRIRAILDSNTGVIQEFELLGTTLIASPTEAGVLQRWADYLKTTRRFYTAVTDPRLIEINEYYMTVQTMAAHLIVEAYVARQTPDGKPNPDRASGMYYLSQLQAAIQDQQTRVAGMHSGNEEVVEDTHTKLVWLRSPVSNFVTPVFDGVWADNHYAQQAEAVCAGFAQTRYAGYQGWRVPTATELHQVTEDGPGTGDAQSEDGVFDWLVEQGFRFGQGMGVPYERGFLHGTAYFSSTWWWGYGREALWNGGVDDACLWTHACTGNSPRWAGVWCVSEGAAAGHE